MPTILRLGSYRLFFFSADSSEPPHVHISRDRAKAKFWLDPVAFASASGFNARELLDIQNLIITHHRYSQKLGMTTLAPLLELPAVPRVSTVQIRAEALVLELADGRTVSAPLAWYPRLLAGSSGGRERFELIGEGEGIHWPDLDEDLSVESVLAGRPSAESLDSFRRWLSSRHPGESSP